jgi:hypothetical protein
VHSYGPHRYEIGGTYRLRSLHARPAIVHEFTVAGRRSHPLKRDEIEVPLLDGSRVWLPVTPAPGGERLILMEGSTYKPRQPMSTMLRRVIETQPEQAEQPAQRKVEKVNEELNDGEPSEIELQPIAEAIRAIGLPVEIEHTGGNIRTLYAGEPNCDGYYPFALGPASHRSSDGVLIGTEDELCWGEDLSDEYEYMVRGDTQESVQARILDWISTHMQVQA